MGPTVRAVYKDRLESAVPRRISICPCSAARTVLVLFADERRGIFRVAPGADVYSLSSAGKSALRDSHRLGRRGHHRIEALTSFTGSPPAGDATADYSDEEMHAALDLNIVPRCLLQNQILQPGGVGRRDGGGPRPKPSDANGAPTLPDSELLPGRPAET